ncbi:zinc-binding dehydrogenase [Xylanimonas ulmi]|uniref:Propanol-preferring alcohol dehydrogenase n=1 Tax=Xylanimonas ulmi TaxID=228973 RepID=A0A4Q7M1E3_9MICO|nr:zinc-binding dehydrogenase [Xylanibacterium ulmi]RZS61051.1 propanol-preferring alcohol dehydrogenase [Xylanibacterium ulmi]
MRAWQFEGLEKGLVLNEVPEPEPGEGEVVVAVRGSGLCHSDLTYMKNPAAMPFLPMTEGHEIAGVIAKIGPGVTGWSVGDRVGVCPSGVAAPAGVFRHGGFADQHVCPAADLARVPDGLSWALAAAATDAGMTSYHAIIKRGGASAGKKVGVIGYGGLGQIATRAAVLAGAEVHVCEPKTEVWDLAREAGAVGVVADAAEWAKQGFDLVVDFAGYGTTDKALAAVKQKFGGRGEPGKVVQVGLGTGRLDVAVHQLLGRDLVGSLGGTVQDIEELYDLMVRGELTPYVTQIGFEEIGAGLERLAAGKVTGRLVAVWGEDG